MAIRDEVAAGIARATQRERRRQSRRALLVVFILIPAATVAIIVVPGLIAYLFGSGR